MASNTIYVVFGMTGAGKTTLVNFITDNTKIQRIKTTTTRPQRSASDNEYKFASNESFEKDSGRYIAVRKYYTLIEDVPQYHYYGVDKNELEHGGVMITDFEGLKELLMRRENVVGIYLYADTKTRRERAKNRPGFKLSEFNRRNEDDKKKFPISQVVKLGTTYPIYILDNTEGVENAIDKIELIINNHK
jgi:guanylate kinase